MTLKVRRDRRWWRLSLPPQPAPARAGRHPVLGRTDERGRVRGAPKGKAGVVGARSTLPPGEKFGTEDVRTERTVKGKGENPPLSTLNL